MKLTLTIILALIVSAGMAQSKYTVTNGYTLEPHKIYPLVVMDSSKVVATLDSENKWNIIDTMATIETLYFQTQQISKQLSNKSELYYALMDVVNASYPKKPSKQAAKALKYFLELRNKQIDNP